MTRIVGGRWAGSRVEVPAHGTRPTSDRVREALFSALEHEFGGFQGVRVLDLFAGSGAIALEAQSRGAEVVVAVDSGAAAIAALRRTIARLPDCTVRVVRSDAGRWIRSSTVGDGFDLVVLDPPYDYPGDALDADLAAMQSGGLLRPAAVVVVERSVRSAPPTWPTGVTADRSRRYGDTTLWYGRAQG